MFCRSRKAVARSSLILLLTAIVSLVIIIYAVYEFYTRADQAVDEPACRGSILTRVKFSFKLAKVVEVNPFPILCKTQEKTLEGNKKQVMNQISDLSARCWWMFLNGEYGNIFNKLNLESDQKCFICYTFKIENDMKITGKDLIDYMGENYYIIPEEEKESEEVNEEGVTYLDYIQTYKGKGIIATSGDIKFIGKEEEIYAIYFISPDNSLSGTLFQRALAWVNPFESLEQQSKQENLAEMNMVYIEQTGVDKDLKKNCQTLESI